MSDRAKAWKRAARKYYRREGQNRRLFSYVVTTYNRWLDEKKQRIIDLDRQVVDMTRGRDQAEAEAKIAKAFHDELKTELNLALLRYGEAIARIDLLEHQRCELESAANDQARHLAHFRSLAETTEAKAKPLEAVFEVVRETLDWYWESSWINEVCVFCGNIHERNHAPGCVWLRLLAAAEAAGYGTVRREE